MATNTPEPVLGSPQEHIPTCDKHSKRIDMFCEDCDELICSKCAKSKHKDHNWDTLANVASQRRKELQTYLTEIKDVDIQKFEEKKEKILKQEEDNKIQFKNDIRVLQKHFNDVICKLTDIKRSNEKTLKNHLSKTNKQIKYLKSQMDEKKSQLVDTVELIENNSRNMSDFHLIDNLKILKQLQCDIGDNEDPLEYEEGKHFNDFRHTWSIDAIAGSVSVIANTKELLPLGICESVEGGLLVALTDYSEYWEPFTSLVRHMTLTDWAYPHDNLTILSSLGQVKITRRKRSGGLLVTLKDNTTQWMNSDSDSRRLVRHGSLTGDTIREYEYTPDGKTKLFTLPVKVTQNGNSDICVVNWSSRTKGNLVILSSAGHLRSIYSAQTLRWNFLPFDVVCDSLCYILVSGRYNERIHLLGPDGEIIKNLLNENEVNIPTSIYLWKSNLWVGNEDGLVKVFK
ncbi:uncharacterized protein LOC134259163 [Saccostrea cucullata]|uniref:uncharacterized protein LOC134259163 n=1 Tax=Saccostrea cuccullata TaxID=36930 RepID=UPI002ED6BD80